MGHLGLSQANLKPQRQSCLTLMISFYITAFAILIFFSEPFRVVIISGLVMRSGSLVVLVLGGIDLGRQQLESSGLLTSSQTHTSRTHDSSSGINKKLILTVYNAYCIGSCGWPSCISF